ncbi:hypothetical protein CT0861_02156 [Colletotrichum tofieldiae]|uniref:Uncharacterized protein n=1 Tax=Colletotrichum tofieldiae TaxID=708197 RepID=A0A166YYA2_9PEZI|nr:hypothetical protein CT0861_02156 [Colletotrichum tofieldiae]
MGNATLQYKEVPKCSGLGKAARACQPNRVFPLSLSLTLPTPHPGKPWNGESRDLEKMNGPQLTQGGIYTQAKVAGSKRLDDPVVLHEM